MPSAKNKCLITVPASKKRYCNLHHFTYKEIQLQHLPSDEVKKSYIGNLKNKINMQDLVVWGDCEKWHGKNTRSNIQNFSAEGTLYMLFFAHFLHNGHRVDCKNSCRNTSGSPYITILKDHTDLCLLFSYRFSCCCHFECCKLLSSLPSKKPEQNSSSQKVQCLLSNILQFCLLQV